MEHGMPDCICKLATDAAGGPPPWLQPAAVVAASGAALVWFLLQLVSGYFNHNLTIELDPTRVRTKTGKDLAAIRIRLRKGSNGRVQIVGIRVRAGDEDKSDQVIAAMRDSIADEGDWKNHLASTKAEFKRITAKVRAKVKSNDTPSATEVTEVVVAASTVLGKGPKNIVEPLLGSMDEPSSNRGDLAYFVPGDGADYGCVAEVDRDKVLRWHVTLIGKRTFVNFRFPVWFIAQWTSSTISLPLAPEEPSIDPTVPLLPMSSSPKTQAQ